MRFLAIISRLGPQMDLMLDIMIADNVSGHLVMARFCHFLEFGTSEGLDIAYYDSTKCFSTFDHGKRSCVIN